MVSVVALMNVATNAHRIEAEAPNNAARRRRRALPSEKCQEARRAGGGNAGRDPGPAFGQGPAAARLGHEDEDRERDAGEDRRPPGNRPDRLVEPEPPQHEREDQFGDEERLDHRDQPVVQGKRLEDERSGQRDPPEEPHRVGQEVANESPTLGVPGVADAGDMLHDDVEGVAERREQGEQHGHPLSLLLIVVPK